MFFLDQRKLIVGLLRMLGKSARTSKISVPLQPTPRNRPDTRYRLNARIGGGGNQYFDNS